MPRVLKPLRTKGGRICGTFNLHKRYKIDDIAKAHVDMEEGLATGKLVVMP